MRRANLAGRNIVVLLAFAAGSVVTLAPAWSQTKTQPAASQPATSQPKTAQAPKGTPNQPAGKAGQPAGAQPAGAQPTGPAPRPEQLVTGDPDMVTLSAFSEPVNMTTLIDLVATTLEINVTVVGEPPGTVRFNAPVPVKKSELISLLQSLLEQQSWTIVRNQFGLYTVQAAKDIPANMRGQLSTTRVFRTPNLRPSTLKTYLDGLIGPPTAVGGTPRAYAFIDDLGLIIATDTPMRLESVAQVVDQIVAEDRLMEFHRISLQHISASVARERALQLLGQMQIQSGSTNQGRAGVGGAETVVPRTLSQLYPLADRLSVDQQGNAVIFRGSGDEISQVQKVLTVIDVPNELEPHVYRAGKAALQVADLARGRGLGEVITISAFENGSGASDARFNLNNPGGGLRGNPQTAQPVVGGPMMVVDENRGQIIYYATASQQSQLKSLLEQLDTDAEVIVTQVYKLRNSDAEEIADVLNGLISNSAYVGEAPLLPGDAGGGGGQRRTFRPPTPRNPRTNQPNMPNQPSQPAGEEGFSLTDENAFVYPDIKNNQIIVKAQAGQQPEFARLIEKLDLRRPQVYVEAKIVVVNADDKLRLAFETQLINAKGTGGVLNTNFGLSSFGTSGTITDSKTIATNLLGATAAVIRSDMVPIVMNALANETDARIVSSPQLLVDDNEEAEVVSLDRQPTSTTNAGTDGNNQIISAGDYAEAGTTLRVTPQISDGGYLRLKYEIILSSFTGEGQTLGSTVLPPPQQENTLKAESITIPSDSTVVVGGLEFNSKTKTVAKVPLLGDIPLFGLLFQDRSTGDRKTYLYVFLTPKVMRDPNFNDLKLLSKGPRAIAELPEDVPSLQPSTMEVVAPRSAPPFPPPPRQGESLAPPTTDPATNRPATRQSRPADEPNPD